MLPRSAASLHALGLSTFRGLPAHVLIVHAVVIFVPLSAIALIAALRPSYARRMGAVLPGLAIVAFLSVLAAMNAGGWLENHVQSNAAVRHHTAMGGQLWPFSAAVALLSLVIWWQRGRASAGPAAVGGDSGRTAVTTIIAVLAVLMAIGSVVQVVRIGESGAHASWDDHFSRTSVER